MLADIAHGHVDLADVLFLIAAVLFAIVAILAAVKTTVDARVPAVLMPIGFTLLAVALLVL